MPDKTPVDITAEVNQALAEQARVMRLHVIDLCSAIHQYRFAKDNYGLDDIRTGRAWDLILRTQQEAQLSLFMLSNSLASVDTPSPFPSRFKKGD